MFDFTRPKFQQLARASQHKKCAVLLRHIFIQHLAKKNVEADFNGYLQLLEWMQEPTLEAIFLISSQEPAERKEVDVKDRDEGIALAIAEKRSLTDAPLQPAGFSDEIMKVATLDRLTPQTIADRYHYHLQQAGFGQKEHHLLPKVRTGDKTSAQPSLPIAIYLDQIRSAHNVGSIIRTVEAFSLGTLYFSASTPFITHKQVQDTAMGSAAWVSCHRNIPLDSLPKPLIALETSEEAASLYDFIFPSTFTLVLGNEEYGCSEETLKAADIILEIPLRGRKNSLNVANAFAIVASEIIRQSPYH